MWVCETLRATSGSDSSDRLLYILELSNIFDGWLLTFSLLQTRLCFLECRRSVFVSSWLLVIFRVCGSGMRGLFRGMLSMRAVRFLTGAVAP